MIQKTFKIEISLPLKAEITTHGDVDLYIDRDAAVEAVEKAVRSEADALEFLMLAESERLAREWSEDRQIEECIAGRN